MTDKPKLTTGQCVVYLALEVLRVTAICFTVSIVNQLLFHDKYTLMFVGIAAGLTIGLTSKILYFLCFIIFFTTNLNKCIVFT